MLVHNNMVPLDIGDTAKLTQKNNVCPPGEYEEYQLDS